jgi:uncharacterized membrane protein HdeD (DUF308 family)
MTNTDAPADTGTPGLQMAREWPALMIFGLITLALGVVIISWPQETLVVISVLMGIQLLIFGVFRLIGAFATDAGSPGWQGFVGIVLIIAGIVVVRHPFETVAVLAVLLGIVWVIFGIVEVISAIADGSIEHRWSTAIAGLVSLAAGILVVSWPAPTVTVIAWISGLYLIIFGLFFCFEAYQLRRLTK